ncbi:MAG: DUF1697 domain-containing protein [Thermoplasmata archaeon]|nr:DUF1697 domain-containing protein [Thermoplasmata archaeon]
MPSYVALLRAVNLVAYQRVAMPALRALVERMGFTEVRTLLASGNLVFRGSAPSGEALEPRLEKEIGRGLGVTTEVMVRSAAEWVEVVRKNPFPKEARDDPARLQVVFLKGNPAPSAWKALDGAIRGPEVVRSGGRHAYITYPTGMGTSRLTMSVIEGRLGTRGTARNWNTVTKLLALADGTAH